MPMINSKVKMKETEALAKSVAADLSCPDKDIIPEGGEDVKRPDGENSRNSESDRKEVCLSELRRG